VGVVWAHAARFGVLLAVCGVIRLVAARE
jgi:hypothetical protein